MILQKVTLQPIDSLFFCWSCCLASLVVALALTTGSLMVMLSTPLSPNLFIHNRPALRHFKHASQDSLYTSCHASELLERAVYLL